MWWGQLLSILLPVVQLNGQAPLPTLRLGRPDVRIGGASGPVDETLLAGVVGATRLPDGAIVIGDGAAPRVLIFSADGRVKQVLGRRGDGPGELRMPRWLGPCNDGGFTVYDPVQTRSTAFSATGSVRGTTPVAAAAGFNQLVACRPGSLYFLLSRSGRNTVDGGTKWAAKAVLVRVRGLTVDTLTASAGIQEYYVNRSRTGFSPVPLGQIVLGTSGPTRIYICENQNADCTVYGPDGTVLGSYTLGLMRHKVSATDWDAARRRLVEAEPLRESQKLRAEVLGELSPPPLFPLIDQIAADGRDRLWVRTFDGYLSDSATWLILRSNGETLARAILPRRLEVLEIGEGYLMGLTRDADGVEIVEFYRMKLPTQ